MSNPTAIIRLTEFATQFVNQTNIGSYSLSEKIAETISNSATADLTITEPSPGVQDTIDNSATITPRISEAISETDTNTMTATTRINAYGDNTYSGGPYGG